MAAISTGRKLSRTHSFTQQQLEEPKEEFIDEHQLASDAATLQLSDHELMHASMMLMHE